MKQSVPFAKMNGIGNKILVMDMRLSASVTLTKTAILRLAAYKETEFDQIMVIEPPRTDAADSYITIWNRDGTQARACGNGMRCVVAYLADGKTGCQFSFEGVAGLVRARSLGGGKVEVDMGLPTFGWADIPTTRPLENTLHVTFVAGRVWDGALVSMGNPHCILFVEEDMQQIALEEIGPILEHDPLFVDKANISLARLMSPTQMRLRTWERGAGLTLACGSAACAAVVASVRRNLGKRQMEVHLPGGCLQIEWDEKTDHVLMVGDSAHEFSGRLDPVTGHFEKH